MWDAIDMAFSVLSSDDSVRGGLIRGWRQIIVLVRISKFDSERGQKRQLTITMPGENDLQPNRKFCQANHRHDQWLLHGRWLEFGGMHRSQNCIDKIQFAMPAANWAWAIHLRRFDQRGWFG